jgi:hypothetical protein
MASTSLSALLAHATPYREPLPSAEALHDALAYMAGFDDDDIGPQALGVIHAW